jgi:hypothetical protein
MRERPKPIWHPVPVTEIWIAAGMIAMVVGLARGQNVSAALPLVAGLGVIAVAVAELMAREHFAGYRRHTVLLAFLVAATVHGALVLLAPVRLIGAGAFALDLVVFAVACGLLDAAWRRRTGTSKGDPNR